MERKIALVVHKKNLHDRETDAAYWRKQSYQARLDVLEEMRQDYYKWIKSQQKDAPDVQSGFPRVYRIIKF